VSTTSEFDVFEARVTPTHEGDPVRTAARLFVGHVNSLSTLVGDILGEDVDHLFDGNQHRISVADYMVEVAPTPTLDIALASADSPGPVALDAPGFSRGEECASPRHRAVYGVRHVCRGCST